MAKDILKEAIADAKAVREVALANAKAALEEAFTPKLQSMLSAKLTEELDEADDMDETMYDEAEDMEETYMDEADDDMKEMTGMEEAEEDMEEMAYDEVKHDMDENLDEEINLEEILSELELEEAEDSDKKVDEVKHKDDKDSMEEAKEDDDKKMKEAKHKDDKDSMEEAKDDEDMKEDLDEARPIYKAEYANDPTYKADYVNEDSEFDLDSLLEEINNLDEKEETDEAMHKDDVDELFNLKPGQSAGVAKEYTTLKNLAKASSDLQDFIKKAQDAGLGRMINNNWLNFAKDIMAGNMKVDEVNVWLEKYRNFTLLKS